MMSSRRLALRAAFVAAAVGLSPVVAQTPTVRTPIGRAPGAVLGPTIPPAIKPGGPAVPPRPLIEDFSVVKGVGGCSDPDNRRPLLQYRVSGGVQFVEIKRMLTSGEVTDGLHLWSSGGPIVPAHAETGIVDSSVASYADRLESYRLEVGGGPGTVHAFRTLRVRFRPPMSLRILGKSVMRTALGVGPRTRFEIAAEYRGLTDVRLQIADATIDGWRKDERSVLWQLDPPAGDPGSPDFGTLRSGRIVWVGTGLGYFADSIGLRRRYTFTGRQDGPCGERYGPPQAPVPGP